MDTEVKQAEEASDVSAASTPEKEQEKEAEPATKAVKMEEAQDEEAHDAAKEEAATDESEDDAEDDVDAEVSKSSSKRMRTEKDPKEETRAPEATKVTKPAKAAPHPMFGGKAKATAAADTEGYNPAKNK